MISMIVAMGENNVIGKDNQLIWNIPEDLKYFKKVTMGKTIVMGRKTYESIGRALPGRRNVVLTRDEKYSADNIHVVNSIQAAIDLGDIIVIGGDAVYKEFLMYANELYVTEIKKEYVGDSRFPQLTEEWVETSSVEGEQSSKELKYFFKKYERI